MTNKELEAIFQSVLDDKEMFVIMDSQSVSHHTVKEKELEMENEKKFTLEITSYGKFLAGIENVNENDIRAFIENYKEPLPNKIIFKSLTELKIGENLFEDRWHINKGKLLTMIPEYHREIKLIRIS
jgi:hypothetical protein